MVFHEFSFDVISWQFQLEFIIKIVLAGICGGIVGFERSKRLKEAGLRTHCVVAVAAALFMIISKYGFSDLTSTLNTVDSAGLILGTKGADPSRIASQVVSGIGFLGAGVIFKNGNVVRGITTAAGIWATAAIGMSIGSGMYIIGIATTIFIMVVQFFMHRFPVGNDAFNTNEIKITMVDSPESRNIIKGKLKSDWVLVVGSKVYRDETGRRMLQITIKASGPFPPEKMMEMMDEYPEIISMSM